ncbi:RimJ/RimL family protein N-acetyltransferase [Nakamurella sp. UYEF19]|uniref:GNAT family N-acetyltransferase n=1 Tax=Nakamurella sp. UYEF19 TaxID=1756392 RepID=UPI0033996955
MDPRRAEDGAPRIEIVRLCSDALAAIAAGDLPTAEERSPIPLSECFVGPDWRSVWTRRRDQIVADPASADWITGAIWDLERHLTVGRAGYHGPPDEHGMVEVGYAVDPAFRRRGYARAAFVSLLAQAAVEPFVTVVRATVSPDNEASRNLILQYGFTHVGEQWDDEDGLELIYEVPA